jgi:hypothetical protein
MSLTHEPVVPVVPVLADLLETYFHRSAPATPFEPVGLFQLYARVYPDRMANVRDLGAFAPILMHNLKVTVKEWTYEFVFNFFVYVVYTAIQRKENVHAYILSEYQSKPAKYQMQMRFVDLFFQSMQSNPFVRTLVQLSIQTFFTLDELLKNVWVRTLLQDVFG